MLERGELERGLQRDWPGLVWKKEPMREGWTQRREMEGKGVNIARGASWAGVTRDWSRQADVAFGSAEQETTCLFGLQGLGKGQ